MRLLVIENDAVIQDFLKRQSLVKQIAWWLDANDRTLRGIGHVLRSR